MRNFTTEEMQGHAGAKVLFAERSELIDAPLDWQKAGLQQTASGYGRKLTTGLKIQFNARAYRLYSTCYSNAGSVWFVAKGQKIFVM